MYLEQIKIKNFRIFNELDLTLNKGLNLLVGENNSGKTALIDAIRYVLGTNSSEQVYINETDFHEEKQNLSIQLKFVDVKKYAHIFCEHLTYEGSDGLEPCLYIQLTAQITNKERRGYPYIQTNLKSGKNGDGLLLESELRNFLATTYLKPLRDAEAELSAGRRSRLSQILASSNDLNIDEILGIIKQANSDLLDNDTKINDTANKIENEFLHQLIFKEDKGNLRALIDVAGIKEVGKNEIEKKRQLRAILESLNLSLSDDKRKHGLGYNNLLFIATELLLWEQDSKADEGDFPLLLIEEPEAHLHPQLQSKLLEFINEKTEKDNLQAILTTHSPNISSKIDPSKIIMIHKGKAFALRPEETKLERDDYRYLRKFLDVTKANLFFARGIIFVEGYAENILVPTIAKLLGRPLEDYGVSIVNVGNKGGWKRFVKIFFRENGAHPMKISVVEDLDLWPLSAEKKDENCFGFKEKKGRNKNNWLAEDDKEKRIQIDEKITKRKAEFEKDNIKIFISDYWTLEYCLAYFGLFDECLKTLNSFREQEINLDTNNEEEINEDLQGVCIQKHVENIKGEFALLLSILLENEYGDKLEDLEKKLPPYLVKAIAHVTEPLAQENE